MERSKDKIILIRCAWCGDKQTSIYSPEITYEDGSIFRMHFGCFDAWGKDGALRSDIEKRIEDRKEIERAAGIVERPQITVRIINDGPSVEIEVSFVPFTGDWMVLRQKEIGGDWELMGLYPAEEEARADADRASEGYMWKVEKREWQRC